MLYYVDKKFLGSVSEVEADGTLTTIRGNIPVYKGQYVVHFRNGEDVVMDREYFINEYTPVKEVKKKTKVNLDEMAKGYMEMAYLNQNEDENYINELKELSQNKAF